MIVKDDAFGDWTEILGAVHLDPQILSNIRVHASSLAELSDGGCGSTASKQIFATQFLVEDRCFAGDTRAEVRKVAERGSRKIIRETRTVEEIDNHRSGRRCYRVHLVHTVHDGGFIECLFHNPE